MARAGVSRFGSRLIERFEHSLEWVITASIVVASLVGAAVVFALASWVVPVEPDVGETSTTLVNFGAILVYLPLATMVGVVWGRRELEPGIRVLAGEEVRSEADRNRILRAPIAIVRVQAVLWGLGAIVFALLNLPLDRDIAGDILIIVPLGGIVTCAVTYLTTERLIRPAVARVLEAGVPERPAALGVGPRSILGWALGSGIPVAGLIMIAIGALGDDNKASATELAIAIIALGGGGLAIGLLVQVLLTRAVSDPIVGVREALAAVERGEFDARVEVYDGTEIGLLQAGFNRMAEGLEERERIRDLFGRHVGEDVAREALEQEVEMGGEVRPIAALFVDLTGSTQLASERPATEVVELLNRFFAIVVEVVQEHGGSVNKFEGDAALAVFGAPIEIPDPAGDALAAARGMADRLREEVPEVDAGIGVSAGEAVAGNIGAETRFEYTVIGDPVNEAARLTDLAKGVEGRVLASESATDSAGESERERWRRRGSQALRGRREETVLMEPAG